MSGLGIVTGRAQPCGAFRIWQAQCPSSSAPPHGRCLAAPTSGRPAASASQYALGAQLFPRLTEVSDRVPLLLIFLRFECQ